MNSRILTTPRARISCMLCGPQALEELTTTFAKLRIEATSPDGAKPVDLGLIDLRSNAVSARQAKKVASALRAEAPDAALAFLTRPDLSADARHALKRLGEVIPVVNELDHVAMRCREILRMRSVAEETGERLKTLASLNRLVEFPVIATDDAPPRILIAGAPGPAAIAAVNAAASVAGFYACAMSAGQVMRALEHDRFDCAVFLPAPENDPMLAVAKTLRRHPVHSGMAVLQIAEHIADMPMYARKGLRESMLADYLADDLAPKLRLASRRTRLFKSMQSFLRSCAGDMVRDAASGAFTPLFLTEHGARLCARADQTGRSLAVTLIALNPHGAGETATRTAPARWAQQTARLINRVSRAEDLTVRIARDMFAIVSPGAVAEDAESIGRRVAGVIANTPFASPAEGGAFAIEAAAVSVGRRRGASIEETIAAAIKRLRNTRRSTQPLLQSPR